MQQTKKNWMKTILKQYSNPRKRRDIVPVSNLKARKIKTFFCCQSTWLIIKSLPLLSLRSRSAVAPLSLQYHSCCRYTVAPAIAPAVAPLSLLLSLRCRSGVAPVSLCCRSAVALLLLWCRSSVAPLLFCYQYTVAPLLLRCLCCHCLPPQRGVRLSRKNSRWKLINLVL